jgi:hypothetical protein
MLPMSDMQIKAQRLKEVSHKLINEAEVCRFLELCIQAEMDETKGYS